MPRIKGEGWGVGVGRANYSSCLKSTRHFFLLSLSLASFSIELRGRVVLVLVLVVARAHAVPLIDSVVLLWLPAGPAIYSGLRRNKGTRRRTKDNETERSC